MIEVSSREFMVYLIYCLGPEASYYYYYYYYCHHHQGLNKWAVINTKTKQAKAEINTRLTTAGTWPGIRGCPGGVSPICCIRAFFKARWFRPLISNWSFRCWGGWKYLQGGFSRLHRPWKYGKQDMVITHCGQCTAKHEIINIFFADGQYERQMFINLLLKFEV